MDILPYFGNPNIIVCGLIIKSQFLGRNLRNVCLKGQSEKRTQSSMRTKVIKYLIPTFETIESAEEIYNVDYLKRSKRLVNSNDVSFEFACSSVSSLISFVL